MPDLLPTFVAMLMASGLLAWVMTRPPRAPRWLSRLAFYNTVALAAIVNGLLIRWWIQ